MTGYVFSSTGWRGLVVAIETGRKLFGASGASGRLASAAAIFRLRERHQPSFHREVVLVVSDRMQSMAVVNTRIFLIRHGATMLSAEDRFAGATDVPLSDEGRDQVSRLAERLSREKVAAVYASPLERTVETASLLAKPHDLPVVTREGLREISHGHWEQLTRREVDERFPSESAAWEADPYTYAPPGGESGLAVTARALPALLEIVRAHPGAQVIVASHKATIRLLLSSLLGFDPRRYRDTLDQNPAALNIIDFKDSVRARLTLFNDTSHYATAGLAIPAVPTARLSKWWHSPQPPVAGGM